MSTDAERRAQRARQRAFRRLADQHPEEFRRFFDEERDAEGIKPKRRRKGEPIPWCAHCVVDQAAYRNGLCRACEVYRHNMGRLPTPTVLHRRVLRRDEERLTG